MIYNEKGALASIQVLFQRIIKVSSVWNHCSTKTAYFRSIFGHFRHHKIKNNPKCGKLWVIWAFPCENLDIFVQNQFNKLSLPIPAWCSKFKMKIFGFVSKINTISTSISLFWYIQMHLKSPFVSFCMKLNHLYRDKAKILHFCW